MNVELKLKDHIQSTYIRINFKSKNCIFRSLLGGGTMTMTKVRSQFSIPTLRNLVKFIIRICRACKKISSTILP